MIFVPYREREEMGKRGEKKLRGGRAV